jgi:hypothetical protein
MKNRIVWKKMGMSPEPITGTPIKITRTWQSRDGLHNRVKVRVGLAGSRTTASDLVDGKPNASFDPRVCNMTREDRRLEAEQRTKHRADLTEEQQLAELDRRLGKGFGAVKERARLNTAIAAKKSTVEEAKVKKGTAKLSVEEKLDRSIAVAQRKAVAMMPTGIVH